MKDDPSKGNPPAILAPAGNRACFLAALAAGADEIYCGLKQFSARMEVQNFSLEELSVLTRLAHDTFTTGKANRFFRQTAFIDPVQCQLCIRP